MEPIFLEIQIDQENRRVCLVDLPTLQTSQNLDSISVRLAERLTDQYGNDLQQTDLLVLRPNVRVQIDNIDEFKDKWQLLSRKAPRASIHLLYSSQFEHQLSTDLSSRHAGESYSTETRDSIIEGIRESEFEHYVDHSDALLSARKSFIYRAPSGQHVRQFLRVGNIQKDLQALDATFFWMLPFLKDRSTIIADTWSISSIAINAARLLERYQSGVDCNVNFFPKYFDGSSDSRHHAETILGSIDQDNESILMLFSAVRSRRSLQRIQEVFSTIHPSPVDIKYLAIYGLDGGMVDTVNIDALCSRLKGFRPVRRTGTVVRIDSGSFFPMIPKDKPLWIGETSAKGNLAFFSHYKDLKATRIHHDVRDSSGNKIRHHAFDISIEDLLLHPRFLDRFQEKLRTLPYPDVIVVPPHKAGTLMGIKAKELLSGFGGQPPNLVDHHDLDPQDDRLKSVEISRQKEILILDDVSITGQRLNRFQANLRSWDFRGHVSYLVGVARPDDEERWQDRVKNLRRREQGRPNDVECLEKIVLPDWHEDKCPWCLEHKWLSDMLRNSAFDEKSQKLAVVRLKLLEEAADGQGLVDNVFWIPPGQQRPTITRGSIFLPDVDATEAAVVASVGGAIQKMRTNPDDGHRLKADFPQPRILKPDNFWGPSPRYNDLILRMSVLRNALPSELVRWDDEDENERSGYLRNALVNDQCCFSLELAVAISQKKFQLPSDSAEDPIAIQPPEVKEILSATLKQQ